MAPTKHVVEALVLLHTSTAGYDARNSKPDAIDPTQAKNKNKD